LFIHLIHPPFNNISERRYSSSLIFLALLELLKQCEISVHQEGEFSEITVKPRDPSAPVHQPEEEERAEEFAPKTSASAPSLEEESDFEESDLETEQDLEPEFETSQEETDRPEKNDSV